MSVLEVQRGCRFVVGTSVYGFGVTALIVRVSGFSWRIDRVLGVLMVSGVQFTVGVSGFNFDVGLMPDVSGL